MYSLDLLPSYNQRQVEQSPNFKTLCRKLIALLKDYPEDSEIEEKVTLVEKTIWRLSQRSHGFHSTYSVSSIQEELRRFAFSYGQFAICTYITHMTVNVRRLAFNFIRMKRKPSKSYMLGCGLQFQPCENLALTAKKRCVRFCN